MKNLQTVKIHIGKHKTGTTAFQKCLMKNTSLLEEEGIYALPMQTADRICAAAIRDNLPIPPVQSRNGARETPSIDFVAQEISEQLAGRTDKVLTISSEHLSYFRTDKEIQRLRKIVPLNMRFEIYVVLRDKADFLNSYKQQITKSGHGPISIRTSPYYCEPDSWLIDDEEIIDLWTRHFESVTVLDYDENLIVGQLINAMGLPKQMIGIDARHNITPPKLRVSLLIFRRAVTLSKLRAKMRNRRRAKRAPTNSSVT